MSIFFSKDKKKSKNEKTVATNSSTTEQNHIIHSSSLTSFSSVQQQVTTQRIETRTTTSIQQIGTSSPFRSESSLNSYTGSNPSLQKNGNKDFNQKYKYLSSVSTDATPFTRDNIYKSTPPRSAFTSTPLTTSTSNTSINLNYRSPYAENRIRSRSITAPGINVNTPTNWLSSRTSEVPTTVKNTVQNKNEDLKEKIVVKVTKSEKFYDDPQQTKVPTYTTRSKHRGKLLLINNIKFVKEEMMRKGAEVDEKHLVQLFQQMGFEISSFQDLNKKNMETKIINFRNNSALKKVDIAAVIIMSHGTGKESSGSTEVVCTDEELVQTTWIINQFDGTLCPHLLGKPKIFIFQCCRGGNQDVYDLHVDSVIARAPRKVGDMLIAYSTIPGFVSHRDPKNGTWYIQAICKIFMEHAHDTDIENLLKMVDHLLSRLVSQANSRQTSSFENRGFKTCYLHPQLRQ